MKRFWHPYGPAEKYVKEALDNLPSGICFFDGNGLLKLCNFTMHRLFFELTGSDLQNIFELREALENQPKDSRATKDEDKFILKDGSVWKFEEKGIYDEHGHSYRQFIASQVTNLYYTAPDMKQKNRELAEMAVHMEHITKNVAAIMREEEILAMKMKIHNELGATILNVRKYYISGCRQELKDDLISNLRKTIGLLDGEIDRDDETDGYKELLELAAAIGVTVQLVGVMPEDNSSYMLIVSAVRECMTNCVRHAKGSKLFVTLTHKENPPEIELIITNNGIVPENEIIEGGGLSGLRAAVEKAGGQMRLQSRPIFSLTVTIPEIPWKGIDFL